MKDGALIAAVNASNGDGELKIFELVRADVDGVLDMVCKEEESGCVFKAAFAEESIGIFEGGGLPARFCKVVFQ